MKSGFLGTVAMFFLGAGWATAQVPAPAPLTIPAPMQPGTAGPGVIPPDAYAGSGGGGPLWYGGAEYLLWKVQNSRLPSTTSTIPVGLISVDTTNSVTTSPLLPGVPLNPTTGFAPVSIMSNAGFGNGPKTETGTQSGARLNVGFWADPDMLVGLEATAFYNPRGSNDIAAISGQSPGQFILDTGFTRTLFLLTAPVPPATTPTLTPLSTTQVFVTRQSTSSLVGSNSASLYGGEFNIRSVSYRIGGMDFGCLGGFRYLNFQDNLNLTNVVRLTQPPGLPPTNTDATASLSRDLSFSSTDQTKLWNNFYGAQVGLDLDAKFGSFFIYARGKIAIGNDHQTAEVNSNTTITNNDPGRSPPSSTSPGGLLAGPLDNGRHSRDVVAYVPEATVNFGYQFTDWLRGFVGYNGLYLQGFARAGESNTTNTLNTNVNVAATAPINVNVAQPTFSFNKRDIYVQGISFGLEAKY